ncbi:MAG: helix-turn-helix domain-containing protein [Pseudomonadota bacterium]
MKQFKKALEKLEATAAGLDPNEISEDDAGWQERKSAQMRVTILEATVQCLAEYGYTKTSTQFVASTAKVSRGAMLHHFPTKLDLVDAVIDHIDAKRLRSILDGLTDLTPDQRLNSGQPLEIVWNLQKTTEAQAHLELNMAARTDAAVREIFDPKAVRYRKLILDVIPDIYPEWRETPKADLELAHEIIMISVYGMNINERLYKDRAKRIAMRNFIFKAAQTLRKDED